MGTGAMWALLVVGATWLATSAVAYQCESKYVPHEAFATNGSRLNVMADGPRFLEAKAYTVGCPTYPYTPTGSEYLGETTLSLNVSTRGLESRCRATYDTASNALRYTSFQATVVRTPGWTVTPRHLLLRDIDAHHDGLASWTETAGVFGLHGGAVVTPLLHAARDTRLTKVDGVLGADDAAAMGIAATSDIVFPAVKGGNADCMLRNTAACQAQYDFQKPIDTLVVLLTTTDKKVDPAHPRTGNMTGVLIGPIITRCGCRCNLKDMGARSVHSPVADGECKRKSTTAPIVACADDGANWCDKKFSVGYTGQGALLPNGNVRCTKVERTQAKFVQDFDDTPLI